MAELKTKQNEQSTDVLRELVRQSVQPMQETNQ